MLASDKDALIAVDRPESPRMPSLKAFEPAQTRMAFIELAIKCASDPGRLAHRMSERLQMRLSQNGIDVVKEQYLARGHFRGDIHLQSAAGSSGCALLDFWMGEIVAGLHTGDDDFVDERV
ncbi:MAG: hypothetical protein QOH39_3282 [Verrucomicrobiota bacterium]